MIKQDIAVLITGGSGFLGKSIVRELLDPDSPVKAEKVRIFDIVEPAEKLSDNRIEFFKGDIRDSGALEAACKKTI